MRVLDLRGASPEGNRPDALTLRQDAYQVQLDTADAAEPTKIILPKGRYRLTVGPVNTTGAEGTFLAGNIRFGRDRADYGGTLEAFESWDVIASGEAERPAVQRRYHIPTDVRGVTFVFQGDDRDAEWMMVTGAATSAVLQLAFDGQDG